MRSGETQILAFGLDRLELLAHLESWHFWFVGRRALIERLVASLALSGRLTLLDVGCGTAQMARRLGTRGFRVIALDNRSEGLSTLRLARAPVWSVQAEAIHLPISSNSCDVVTVLDVMEHVDDRALVTELERVTKPGSALVITVPAAPWLWSARDEVAGHRRRYTRGRLITILEAGGFEIMDVRLFQCLLLPLVIIARLAGRRAAGTLAWEEQPSRWINGLLTAINRFEVHVGQYVRWPWGSSLAGVCRKTQAST